MTMTLEELREKINPFIDQEDEQGLERFVIEHFKEFPEDIQGKVLAAFVEEAVDKREGESSIEKLQKEGMEAMTKISALKAVLSLPPQSS
jgi:hypothetical protein